MLAVKESLQLHTDRPDIGSSEVMLIFNPTAGRGRPQLVESRIRKAFEEAGFGVRFCRTSCKGEATSVALEAARSGAKLLVAAGGDGTVHEVANGILLSNHGDNLPTLGIIPCGTGNDYAAQLELSRDLETAVRRICGQGRTRSVDVGRVNGRHFLNDALFGFAAEAARESDHYRGRHRGSWVYLAGVAKALRHLRCPTADLEWEGGGTQGQELLLACAAVGSQTGGGLKLAPGAILDDGLFDIITAPGMKKFEVLKLLPKLITVTHIHDPRVRQIRSPWLRLRSNSGFVLYADGEALPVPGGIADFRIIPKALRIAGLPPDSFV